VASVVAHFLLPWVDDRRVEEGLSEFLNDPERNLSPYLATWLFAMMLERTKAVPERWTLYARNTARDKNQPVHLRVLAVNMVVLGGHASDVDWIRHEIRTEPDLELVRGFLAALRRIGKLDDASSARASSVSPALKRTCEYLKQRRDMPSLMSRSYRLPLSVPRSVGTNARR
jgi:hypothetical protein